MCDIITAKILPLIPFGSMQETTAIPEEFLENWGRSQAPVGALIPGFWLSKGRVLGRVWDVNSGTFRVESPMEQEPGVPIPAFPREIFPFSCPFLHVKSSAGCPGS